MVVAYLESLIFLMTCSDLFHWDFRLNKVHSKYSYQFLQKLSMIWSLNETNWYWKPLRHRTRLLRCIHCDNFSPILYKLVGRSHQPPKIWLAGQALIYLPLKQPPWQNKLEYLRTRDTLTGSVLNTPNVFVQCWPHALSLSLSLSLSLR